MKALVTGGAGFIGAAVVRNLLRPRRPGRDRRARSRTNAVLAEARRARRSKPVDVADAQSVERVFVRHPDITHCIHLAYLMSAEVEADMALGVKVNLLGMVNMFEAAAAPQARAAGLHQQRDRVRRLASASTATGRGRGRLLRPERPFFTYGVMKILDEFMAQKYVARHGVSIACVRPPVVFGHGRKRGSVLWAEDFATEPALGRAGEAALLAPLARHLDLQGRLRRAARAARPQTVARPFRLQQRRRERDGGGARGGRAPLAAGRRVRVRRDQADHPADRPAGRAAARGGDRFRAARACSTACAPTSTKRARRRASSPCEHA